MPGSRDAPRPRSSSRRWTAATVAAIVCVDRTYSDPHNVLSILPLHLLSRRDVARLEGGSLRLLRGVGFGEPEQILLRSIIAVKRINARFLNIHHEGGTASVEATRAVLDELERDLWMPSLPSGEV